MLLNRNDPSWELRTGARGWGLAIRAVGTVWGNKWGNESPSPCTRPSIHAA